MMIRRFLIASCWRTRASTQLSAPLVRQRVDRPRVPAFHYIADLIESAPCQHGGTSIAARGGPMRTLLVLLAAALSACSQPPVTANAQTPSFRVDPAWPRALPEENGVQLVLGQVAGIAVDERNGHVWIIHRPATLLADEWNPK